MRWPLNALLAALVGIALGLSGCATLNTACNVAPLVSASAADAITILERDWHLDHAKAVQWQAILATGAKGASLFCGVAGR